MLGIRKQDPIKFEVFRKKFSLYYCCIHFYLQAVDTCTVGAYFFKLLKQLIFIKQSCLQVIFNLKLFFLQNQQESISSQPLENKRAKRLHQLALHVAYLLKWNLDFLEERYIF